MQSEVTFDLLEQHRTPQKAVHGHIALLPADLQGHCPLVVSRQAQRKTHYFKCMEGLYKLTRSRIKIQFDSKHIRSFFLATFPLRILETTGAMGRFFADPP